MLLKQNDQKAVSSILFTGLLTLLASCGNSSALESMVKADPELRERVESTVATSTNQEQDSAKTGSNIPPGDTATVEEKDIASGNQPSNKVLLDDDAIKPVPKQEKTNSSLPENFPASFPIYPKVQLKEAKTGENQESGMLTWTSFDNSKAIADYYQAELTANDWEITKPFKFDAKNEIGRAIAVKDNQKVHLNLLRSKNSETGNDGTKLSVIYEPIEQDVATSNIPPVINSKLETNKNKPESDLKAKFPTVEKNDRTERTSNRLETPTKQALDKRQDIARKNIELPENGYTPDTNIDFTDLDNVPEQLSQPLETVANLGILTPYTQEGNVELGKFAPNASITRGEYARWLVAANNRYYQSDSGKKIYVVKNTAQPAFQDVKQDNPDFGAIQGLAEAGLVPSRLTQDSTNLSFRPNAPLTREELVTWKVPLDTRQALPKASIEAIEESWGFQDAANIDSSAIRALYADYQNGDRANVRRIFGFTTLFQAKKPVTRAEAAASLWYFGFQGDGITAQEILESEKETESNS